MRPLPLAAIALAFAAVPAFAKPPAGPEMRWAHSWKEALQEAKERNVPIMVAFHKDN
jgi:hypothetical protein